MKRNLKSARRGRRSNYEAKSWRCQVCRMPVEPVQCTLVDIPKFECPKCRTKSDVVFDFNILRFHKNKIKLRTRIYDQGSSGLSAMYACKSLAEIKARIDGAETGWFVDPCLDEDNMLDQYAVEAGAAFDKEGRGCKGEFRVKKMLQALKRGVKIKRKCGDSPKQAFQIKDISRTSKADFSKICELLANGVPLLGGFYAGQNFGELENNEVYKSPPEDRLSDKSNTRLAHAVCIVGAGARFEGKNYVRYLWFRNSHGKAFGRRGDGMVRFKDLMFDPYIISL